MLPNIIETERLRLRPIGLQDVEAVLSYAADPEWAQYLPVPQPYLREHAEQFLSPLTTEAARRATTDSRDGGNETKKHEG